MQPVRRSTLRYSGPPHHMGRSGRAAQRRHWGGESGISIVLRGLILDAPPDLCRQRFPALLVDMCDEADRAGHDRKPAAHLPRKVELAENRADGAGGIDCKLAPVAPARRPESEVT